MVERKGEEVAEIAEVRKDRSLGREKETKTSVAFTWLQVKLSEMLVDRSRVRVVESFFTVSKVEDCCVKFTRVSDRIL